MILTTTNTIETNQIKDYLGIVTGETIIGANIFDILRYLTSSLFMRNLTKATPGSFLLSLLFPIIILIYIARNKSYFDK